MQTNNRPVKDIAHEILSENQAERLLGWKRGEFFYDNSPAVFSSVDELEDFVYDLFCGSNLSKFLIKESAKEGRIAVLLKPCDRYSFNQLVKEHRINRENVLPIEIDCDGMVDIEKVKALGIKGVKSIEADGDQLIIETVYGQKSCKKEDVLLMKCLTCKDRVDGDRFALVREIEEMTSVERYEFWRSELSKCIRCNACRNVCPACTCEKCVFDNDKSGIANKANSDSFEENLYHMIRAFHVAGRCTDCGECTRVCPQGIPLHLINRKVIKDLNEFYGEYQAGADDSSVGPLTSYQLDDVEPDIVMNRGGAR